MRATLVAPVIVLLATTCGCSSSGSGGASDGGAPGESFMGLIGCDAGSPTISTECALTLPLGGAISGTFSNFSSCGSSVTSLSWGNGGQGIDMAFQFMGATPPVDQLGTFPLHGLDIVSVGDGAALRWSVPPAGCTVTIDGSICSPDAVFKQRRVLYGRGTCTSPAAPQPGNSEGPVTVGDFTFVGFINPM